MKIQNIALEETALQNLQVAEWNAASLDKGKFKVVSWNTRQTTKGIKK